MGVTALQAFYSVPTALFPLMPSALCQLTQCVKSLANVTTNICINKLARWSAGECKGLHWKRNLNSLKHVKTDNPIGFRHLSTAADSSTGNVHTVNKL